MYLTIKVELHYVYTHTLPRLSEVTHVLLPLPELSANRYSGMILARNETNGVDASSKI